DWSSDVCSSDLTDLLIRYPELDGFYPFMYEVDMIDRQIVYFTVHRVDVACMVLRQHKRRADRPEHAVVDRGDLCDLYRFERWMDQCTAQSLVVGRRS